MCQGKREGWNRGCVNPSPGACVCVCVRAVKVRVRELGLAARSLAPRDSGLTAASPLPPTPGRVAWHCWGKECSFGGSGWTDSRAMCSEPACGRKEHQLGRETVQELRTCAKRHGNWQAGSGHMLEIHRDTEALSCKTVCGVSHLPPSWLLPAPHPFPYSSEQLKQRPPCAEGLKSLLQNRVSGPNS